VLLSDAEASCRLGEMRTLDCDVFVELVCTPINTCNDTISDAI